MGLKKYEIITVGGNKRVRALRSWQVGGRYVNIGDVGGIVYDEKTLSQDGLCWLFSGNFGFPGARISGDSIVDVLEVTNTSSVATPAVDILGSSVVVGSKLKFLTDQTADDAVVLTAADFEQGLLTFAEGANWETRKSVSVNFIRSKAPIFMGGVGKTIKLGVPGYTVQACVLDRDGKGVTATAATNTGEGVTLAIPAGQYFVLSVTKKPLGPTVPADATAAQITFKGTYDSRISIIDSRVEINPATNTGETIINPSGQYTIGSGAKYPDSVIRNSKVAINGHATANRTVRLISEFAGCNVAIDTTTGRSLGVGIHSNVKNLMISGEASANWNVAARSIIQANNCDNFAVSPTIFPGLAAAQTANMPFIFQGCNVPDGRFYHRAQIANTYKNIDFSLAQADLGKQVGSIAGRILVSSEVEGMYRIFAGSTSYGALVESYGSVKSLTLPDLTGAVSATYGTTIYKDAYLNGLFDITGTNVFGNTKKHDTSNTQDVSGVLVKGIFNATTNGSVISGVVANNARAVVAQPFRVSGAGGVSVSSPVGVECNIYLTDATNKIIVNTGYVSGNNAPIVPALPAVYAYIAVKKTDGSDILPTDEFKGVTVTVYNGCKIVNTGATAIPMKGNIRVEDNATLVNASITGTGYFGGNSIVYRDPKSVDFYGTVHMKDNAVFAPNSIIWPCALVHMEGNAKFVGSVTAAGVYLSVIMAGNAIVEGAINTRSGIVMYGNSRVAPTGIISVSSRGTLVMTDNASIEVNMVFMGAITLAGNYKGDVEKTWVGKRTITDVNEPQYDNNVKSKYDL